MNNPRLYRPTGLNSDFFEGLRDFSDYIIRARAMLVKARVIDLSESNVLSESILEANAPQQFIPPSTTAVSKVGVLLVHGLFYAPAAMSSLFDFFKKRNCYVASVLLPGHGTVPGDLLEVGYDAWLRCVAYAIEELRPQVDKLWVVGVSTGADLAMYHALRGEPIDGLVSFAPALSIRNPCAFLSVWQKQWRKFFPYFDWFKRAPEIDYSRYLSIPMNAIAQVYELGNRLRKMLARQTLHIPQFLIGTEDDEVVGMREVKSYFEQHRVAGAKAIFYRRGVFKPFIEQGIEIRNSTFPDLHIKSFSHIGMQVSPEHPLYGLQGSAPMDRVSPKLSFLSAKENENFELIPKGALMWRDSLRHPLFRLSFNPDFDALMEKLAGFMEI